MANLSANFTRVPIFETKGIATPSTGQLLSTEPGQPRGTVKFINPVSIVGSHVVEGTSVEVSARAGMFQLLEPGAGTDAVFSIRQVDILDLFI